MRYLVFPLVLVGLVACGGHRITLRGVSDVECTWVVDGITTVRDYGGSFDKELGAESDMWFSVTCVKTEAGDEGEITLTHWKGGKVVTTDSTSDELGTVVVNGFPD